MKNFKYLIALLLLFSSILFGYKAIEIDLSKQKIYAKENGNVVFHGAISSGNRRHKTPSGTFYILEKDRYHYSSKYPEPYGGAKMPYMLRLTNSGIAIHQGYLPGYPASHGCIRVSHHTAKKLWRWTNVGTKVVLHNGRAVRTKRTPRYTRWKKPYKKRYTKKQKYKYKKRPKYVRNTRYRNNYSKALRRIIFK